jgi:hypothetical protein
VLLEITKYEEGVISMQKDGKSFEFLAIDAHTIYDCRAKELLSKRGEDG